MKALIPVAGIGTRLRPQTNTVPKILVHVAGKPMLGHILDDLKQAGITDIVLIVGYLKEQVIQYVQDEYSDLKIEYIEQKEMLGLGHAIWTAKASFTDEMLIILGDTIYDLNLKDFINQKVSTLGLKQVDDPRRFGVAELDESNKFISHLVEKPEHPKSNLAIVGLYYIKNSALLLTCLQELIDKNIRTKNEYQLTDALELMLKKGEPVQPYEINGWYDCGIAETLIETNKILLAKKKDKQRQFYVNSLVIEPCIIHPSVQIENSIVGPNVSIAKDSIIKQSIVKNSILTEKVTIINSLVEESIIGANSIIHGKAKRLNIGAFTEISKP
jgi:glucose-1-phosphate thymidylyltransferase